MKALARRTSIVYLVAFLLATLGVGTATAAPVWNLDIHHNETHFAPGSTGEYWLEANNVGDEDSSGPITLKLSLPPGITRNSVRLANVDAGADFNHGPVNWSCPGSPGDSSLTCTTSSTIARHSLSRNLFVTVDVAGAPGVRFASAKLEGGGATNAPTAVEPTEIDPEPAEFGILPYTFTPDFLKADGLTTEREAGAHPDLAIFPFDFSSVDNPNEDNPARKGAAGSVRNVVVDTPPGFVGAPTAVGECTQAEFTLGECPASSQVGRFDVTLAGLFPNHSQDAISVGVFNLSHPRGFVTDLAFVVAGNPVHIKVSLDPANRYAIRSSVLDINETLPPFHQRFTLWGVPADPSHDAERCLSFAGAQGPFGGGDTSEECSTDIEPKPFLTLPSQCTEDNVMRLHHYDSWQDTGDFGPDIHYTMPGKMTDCDKPRFEPSVSLRPTGTEAGTPTGLDVSVHVPQNENPNALATPPIKSTTVILPEGMAVNPAFSDGLQGCSESEIGLKTNRAVRCPDNSRIGEVELSTPLLPKAVEGSMYLAEQGDNPFGSLIAFYLALHDTEERGILVKVPGKVELDSKTGQITTVFDDLPQFPFEDLTLKFRSGERAPLVNPPTCGRHRIEATLASYAQPGKEIDATNSYELDDGPGGGDCVSNLSSRPFEPQLLAGTYNPVAGAFSPMALRVTRTDADQELFSAQGTAPLGLSASLVGVARCSEAQIAKALRRDDPGDGQDEQSDPSCPAASQVGTVDTGAGAGPAPIYVPGKIYLAGPYKGAPLSGVAIVPAVAGPVDLGVVVVRAPAYIDPRTAQLRIASDPLPQVVNGILVRVRDVRIRLDRPNFVINPTSCAPQGIAASLFSTEGKAKGLFNRFQVGECGSLGFKPRLGIRLKGGTGRGAHPALTAVVRPRPGHANFQRAVVTLPRSAFLDQGHIRTICTRVQFAAGAGNGTHCPPGARYGFARAWTPLIEGAFQGPVFLRSSNNKLPDMVVALKGPPGLPVDVELSSRIDSFKGGIRSTFTGIPDVPVSRFVLNMQGGKKGLVVNSRNLCARKSHALAVLRGQNGKVDRARPVVRPLGCKKNRKAKRSAHRRAATGR